MSTNSAILHITAMSIDPKVTSDPTAMTGEQKARIRTLLDLDCMTERELLDVRYEVTEKLLDVADDVAKYNDWDAHERLLASVTAIITVIDETRRNRKAEL